MTSSQSYEVFLQIVSSQVPPPTITFPHTTEQIIECHDIATVGMDMDKPSFYFGYESRTLNPDRIEDTDPEYIVSTHLRQFSKTLSYSLLQPLRNFTFLSVSQNGTTKKASGAILAEPYKHKPKLLRWVRFQFSFLSPVFRDNGRIRAAGWDVNGPHGENTFGSSPRLLQFDSIEFVSELGLLSFSSSSEYPPAISFVIDGVVIPPSSYEIVFFKDRHKFFQNKLTLTMFQETLCQNDSPLFEIILRNVEADDSYISNGVPSIQAAFIRSSILISRSKPGSNGKLFDFNGVSARNSGSLNTQKLFSFPSPPDITHLQLAYPPSVVGLDTTDIRILFSLTYGFVQSPISIILQTPSNVTPKSTLNCTIRTASLGSRSDNYSLTSSLVKNLDMEVFSQMDIGPNRFNITHPSITLAPHTEYLFTCSGIQLAAISGVHNVNTIRIPYDDFPYYSRYIFSVYKAPFYIPGRLVEYAKGSHQQSYNHPTPVTIPSFASKQNTFCGVMCLTYRINWKENEMKGNSFRILLAPINVPADKTTTTQSTKTLKISGLNQEALTLAVDLTTCKAWASKHPVTKPTSILEDEDPMTYLAHPDSLTLLGKAPAKVIGKRLYDLPPHPFFDIPLENPIRIDSSTLEVKNVPSFSSIPITSILIHCNNTLFSVQSDNDYGYGKVQLVDNDGPKTVLATNNDLILRLISPYYMLTQHLMLDITDFFLTKHQFSSNSAMIMNKLYNMELPSVPNHLAAVLTSYVVEISHEYFFPSVPGLFSVNQRKAFTASNALPLQYELDVSIHNFAYFLASAVGLGSSHPNNLDVSILDLFSNIGNMHFEVKPRFSYAWITNFDSMARDENGSFPHTALPNITIRMLIADSSQLLPIHTWTVDGVSVFREMPEFSLEKFMLISSAFRSGVQRTVHFDFSFSDMINDIKQRIVEQNMSSYTVKDFLTAPKRIVLEISLPTIEQPRFATAEQPSSIGSIFASTDPLITFSLTQGYFELNASIVNSIFDKATSLGHDLQVKHARTAWSISSCDLKFQVPDHSFSMNTPPYLDRTHAPFIGASEALLSHYNSKTSNALVNTWCTPPLASEDPTFDTYHTGNGTLVIPESNENWHWNGWDSRFGSILPPKMYISPVSHSSSVFELHIVIQPPLYISALDTILHNYLQVDFTLPKDVIPIDPVRCRWGIYIDPNAPDAELLDPNWQETVSHVNDPDSVNPKDQSIIASRIYKNDFLRDTFFPNFLNEISVIDGTQSQRIKSFKIPPKMHIKCDLFALKSDETGSMFPRAEFLNLSLSSFGKVFANSKKMLFQGFLSPTQTQVSVASKAWYSFSIGLPTKLHLHFENLQMDVMKNDSFQLFFSSSMLLSDGVKYKDPFCHITTLSDNASPLNVETFHDEQIELPTTTNILSRSTVMMNVAFIPTVLNEGSNLGDHLSTGILRKGASISIECGNVISPPTPPRVELVEVSSVLTQINFSLRRPLKSETWKTLGFGQFIKPSPSLQRNNFGEDISTMSVNSNDIRPNGNLVFFNATIAPFRMNHQPQAAFGLPSDENSPGFTEGNVLVSVLPNNWVLNQLPEEKMTCFFKMFSFGKRGPYKLFSPLDLADFKLPYAPEATRFAIRSFGKGPNRVSVVAMELGSLKTDNSIMIAKRRKKHLFMDGMFLNDPTYHADALSMVCMSNVKTPVSYDENSDMVTNGPISSAIPVVFLKEQADSLMKQETGTFLLFSSWKNLEQAFELYSLYGSVQYTPSIHLLAKYHRSHVEASQINYLQHPVGWNPRSLLRLNLRFLTASPLNDSQLEMVRFAWEEHLSSKDESFETSFSTQPTALAMLFGMTTKIFKQTYELFSYNHILTKILYPEQSNENTAPQSSNTNTSFTQVPTVNVLITFDVVTFGVSEQRVKDLLDEIVPDISQSLANQTGFPLFIGLDAGSLILPEYCYDGLYSFQHADSSQNETDLDCGGEKCKQCGVGGRCLWDSDCITLHCDKVSYTCDVASADYLPDVHEHNQWFLENQPFNVFDRSPTIDPYESLLRSLHVTP